MRIALAAVVVVAGCFRPDESKIKILCGNPADCPEGQACVEGICGPQPDADLAGTDAAFQDFAGVPTDLASPAGCTAGKGLYAGPRATACPGTFDPGQARGRCAAPWQVCAMAANVDLQAAGKLAGFFVADQPAYWLGARSAVTCGTSTSQQLFYGVGSSADTVQGTRKCGGFPTELEVGNGWKSSANGTLDQARNTNAADGVLCCSP